MTRTKEEKYFWYIEPMDSHSNMVIAARLPEENEIEGAITENGTRHNLWGCDYPFAAGIWKSKSDLNLDIRIYGRQGKNGKIRNCTFIFSHQERQRKRQRKGWQRQTS